MVAAVHQGHREAAAVGAGDVASVELISNIVIILAIGIGTYIVVLLFQKRYGVLLEFRR